MNSNFKILAILIPICLVRLFSSCTNNVKCEEFNYKGFGIDTLEIRKNQLLTNGDDSLILKVAKCEIVNLTEDTESPLKVAECNNGITIDLECDSLGLFFTYRFSLREDGYSYMIVSPYFDMRTLKVKNMNDINTIIENFEENNGKKPKVKLIEIKAGKIIKIVDSNDNIWN